MRKTIYGASFFALASLFLLFLELYVVNAFAPAFVRTKSCTSNYRDESTVFLFGRSLASKTSTGIAAGGRIVDVPQPSDSEEPEPALFYDTSTRSYIEVYIDHIAELEDGSRYHIGMPCDYAVTLCYFEDDNLIPIELGSDLMKKIFPVAESLLEDEFGEELVLQNTPQTLTLVGELDLDIDEDDDEDDNDLDEDGEEVEILLTFDYENIEYSLVRLLDPVLLVARDPINQVSEVDEHEMLTVEDSEKIVPQLEKLFMDIL